MGLVLFERRVTWGSGKDLRLWSRGSGLRMRGCRLKLLREACATMVQVRPGILERTMLEPLAGANPKTQSLKPATSYTPYTSDKAVYIDGAR